MDFTKVKVRKTVIGWKRAKVHTVPLWYWDVKEQQARKRALVITCSDKTKFSLSNGHDNSIARRSRLISYVAVIGWDVALMTVEMNWACPDTR